MMSDPLLENFQLHIELSQEDYQRIRNLFVDEIFRKGQYLIQPSHFVHHQYFVLEGNLRTFMIDHKGKEHTLQFAVEGWWVSDYLSYYQNIPSALHVECLEECHLLKVSKTDLINSFDEFPVLERFFRKQLENAFVAFQQRILSNLQDSAEERYSAFVEKYPSIEQRVKNYQIASYLGIAPESLSRLRKQRMNSL
ncbi:MAG: Crp/Fnr family transcriptional regulator [Cytophagales bacterium]|nr:Crp/Fnr family transcriptional regulator [Cytophagales bacterium]